MPLPRRPIPPDPGLSDPGLSDPGPFVAAPRALIPRALVPVLAALILFPQTAAAHPHEFIDTRLTLRFDDTGALTAVGVEWRYDAFTSMLILSDLGLNPAADTLEGADAETLSGFDTNWVEGYNGDLWPAQGATEIALGAPLEGHAWLDDGQIVSRHWRQVLDPVNPEAGALSIRVFDPEYYIAYTIADHAQFEGRSDCHSRLFGPDLSAAQDVLQAALDELLAGGVQDVEANFPAVGAHFAEELLVECGPEVSG
ncbi:MAG: DUF1007 family protein [Pararhodobacter sp.]|nr:DUF1007 family protein [Pararhodobacter sp.]